MDPTWMSMPRSRGSANNNNNIDAPPQLEIAGLAEAEVLSKVICWSQETRAAQLRTLDEKWSQRCTNLSSELQLLVPCAVEYCELVELENKLLEDTSSSDDRSSKEGDQESKVDSCAKVAKQLQALQSDMRAHFRELCLSHSPLVLDDFSGWFQLSAVASEFRKQHMSFAVEQVLNRYLNKGVYLDSVSQLVESHKAEIIGGFWGEGLVG